MSLIIYYWVPVNNISKSQTLTQTIYIHVRFSSTQRFCYTHRNMVDFEKNIYFDGEKLGFFLRNLRF
jgi:hypothetical protein